MASVELLLALIAWLDVGGAFGPALNHTRYPGQMAQHFRTLRHPVTSIPQTSPATAPPPHPIPPAPHHD